MPYPDERRIPNLLEFAFRGPTIDPQPQKPKTWISTILSAVGLSNLALSSSSWKLTTFARLFDGLHNKKIILGGLDAAGKTTCLRNHISLDRTCRGQDIMVRRPLTCTVVEGIAYPNEINFHSIDVGGGAPKIHKSMERAIIRAGDAVVWLVDSTDRDRLVEAKEELYRGLGTPRCGGEDEKVYEPPRSVPVLILVTKRDLESQAMSMEEIKQGFGDISTMLSAYPFAMFGVGEKSKKEVHAAFGWLADRLREVEKEKNPTKKWLGFL